MEGRWSQIRLYREARLDDEQECLRWCMRVGLIRPAKICRRDRVACALKFRADRQYSYWRCPKCSQQASVFEGSIFEEARIPLSRALVLMLCFAHLEGYDNTQRACIFGLDSTTVGSDTIASWNLECRERIATQLESIGNGEEPIGGPEMIVQIDEAQIGRRKYNVGRWTPETWVLGMVDSDNKLRVMIVEERNRATLCGEIVKHVERGSIIHTDGWKAYCGLTALGFEHHTVNHKKEFVAADGTHTQKIESEWRAIRRKFSKGGIRRNDIGIHLIEYMWRRECYKTGVDPFARLVEICRVQ